MWSRIIDLAFNVSTFFWIRLAGVLKNIINMTKFHKGFINAFIPLYLNIYHVINKAWPRVSTTRQFYFTQKNCFLYYQIHISQIYTIRMQIRAYHMKRYVTICSYFPFFFVTYLAYIIFLLVCGNFLPTSNTRRCWNSL